MDITRYVLCYLKGCVHYSSHIVRNTDKIVTEVIKMYQRVAYTIVQLTCNDFLAEYVYLCDVYSGTCL